MFKKILVPVDLQGPAFADKALAMAVEEAQPHKDLLLAYNRALLGAGADKPDLTA